jgi:hypothetical protein
MTLRLYRAVKAPRGAEDFRSPKAQGRKLKNLSLARFFDGVSFWDEPDLAKQQADQWPNMGEYIVAVEIPEGVPAEETMRPGHYTVWAEAEELAAWVVQCVHKDHVHDLYDKDQISQ